LSNITKLKERKKRNTMMGRGWWVSKTGVEDEAVAQSGPTFSTTGVQRS
jgi:hypothetical protein